MDGRQKPIGTSLQRRLSMWIALFTIGISMLAAAYSFMAAFHEAHELQDGQLRQIALIAIRQGLPEIHDDDESAQLAEESETNIIIQRLGRGKANNREPLDFPNVLPAGYQTISYHGNPWRVYVHTAANGEQIAVGQQTAARDEIVRASSMATLVPLLVMLPILLMLTHWVIRRALAPVLRLAELLDKRDDDNLDTLPETDIPSEVQPFVAAINRLMVRIAHSMEQQRRFIADAAHELRTPITALTVQAGNLDHVDLPPAGRERLQTLKTGLSRTRLLLEQLLSMARAQSGGRSGELLDMADIARALVADIYPYAQEKGVDLGFARLETVCVRAGPLDLLTLMRNAIDNAVRYTQAGGTVNVSCFREGISACFAVDDTGPGIPEADLLRIFDPFFRVIGNEAQGSGLGLAIVRTIAVRLGGVVALSNVTDEGRTGVLFRYSQACADEINLKPAQAK